MEGYSPNESIFFSVRRGRSHGARFFFPSVRKARSRERSHRSRNAIYFSFYLRGRTGDEDDERTPLGDAGDADGDEQLEI